MFKSLFQSGPSDKDHRNRILIDPTDNNPFPGRPATATPDNPPSKLLGRQNEFNEMLDFIKTASKTDNRPLIIIQGETGMGKSALTSYIFNEIKNEKIDREDGNFYSVFLEAYGEVKDFRLANFFRQMIISLERYGFLSRIVARMVQFIGQTIYNADLEYFSKEFDSWDPFEVYQSTRDRLNDRFRAETFIKSLKEGLSMFYPEVQSRWNKIDAGLMNLFLHSQATTKHRINAIEALRSGKQFEGYSVSTDMEARNALHSIIDLLIAINPNSVMVIFLDQLEELFEIVEPKKIAMKVFTLLLTLRQVPNILLVLSGNLQAYHHLRSNFEGDTDDQIEQWHHYLHITRLDAGEVVNIVYHHLTSLWSANNLNPDPQYPYYPLSQETITYLYEKYDRNLRKTLIGLHDIFNNFKTNKEVKDLSDPIKSIGDLEIIQNPLILPLQIQRDFSEYLISDKIQDKHRARIPEEAIFKLFKIIVKHKDYISALTMSKKMKNSGRQPDIYYRLGGTLFHYNARDIGIEVKCYRKGEFVPAKIVRKTVELLEKKDLDYVIWVTNVELHHETLNSLDVSLKKKQIGITPKTDEQMAYLYWSYIFKDAMGREPDVEEALTLLDKIGIPELFTGDPTNLLELEQERIIEIEEEPKTVTIEEPTTPPKLPGSSQITLEEFTKEPVDASKPQIGIDLHDKMQKYLINTFNELKNANRKQINKSILYSNFLKSNDFTEIQVPETEFLELVESYAKKSENLKTTQKLVKLQY